MVYKICFLSILAISLDAQTLRKFDIQSPDKETTVHIEIGEKLQWSVFHNGVTVIEPSSCSLQLENGKDLGNNAKILSSKNETIDRVITPVNYFKSEIKDQYNQLIVYFKEEFGIIFRVYNDGMAYRFTIAKKDSVIIRNEEANFNFTNDDTAFIPYMAGYRQNKIFNTSFESHYSEVPLSHFEKDSLAFLPVLVNLGGGMKAEILEADLENYPGMFLQLNHTQKGFAGVFAPYPLEVQTGGYETMNEVPVKRAEYIARIAGKRPLPWRVVVVSDEDKNLMNCDIVQKLASPPRINDVSWIRPGQVSWDWWNGWNISHVDFKAGINTATYKYYIDFASAHHIPYIVMDEGWSQLHDLTAITPGIDLKEIIEYGKQKNVDVILWALWTSIKQQMNAVFPLYAGMGVKGFKIDFIDRDDQLAVASTYEIAKKAAESHLLVDYHGVFKPTGLQRTYPNVIGYEGVKGMEYVKWSAGDVPRFDVSIPYIRMLSGPMDYTPGAMRNATKENFRSVFTMPMSQGTRCHQLSMYVVFFAPLQMLSDNPTAYMREPQCTDFITSIPTTFDETVPLAGTVGSYAAIARRKRSMWYVGAMTNWDARDVTLNFSFLEKGNYHAIIFSDGINADRDATDFKIETTAISAGDSLTIHLAPGGGWAARIEKIE